ncbi:MAG: PIN domain-containing protein [Solirubrobacteraceae bacterium]
MFDTGVWTWVRDRRFPHLAEWFNDAVAAELVLVCDLVVLELVRLTPNERRATDLFERLSAFESLPMATGLSSRACEMQLALAKNGDHRRVPPADLLLAAAAVRSGAPLVHYDRDYERIAAASDLQHVWFVPDGSLA